ncbi:hypothetical protein DH2020_044664 [Rehmannia glutinosa]|uniref:Late embryogenesis abundant protein n=1 Tax=Rehmannia glutinosa TaxID=99300 RepID=A0ABR0UGB3_REHGL
MQTIKEKLSDMSAMRQAKAEAKEEEKAEKELAKTRVQVAHEVRMAREAEAAMDLHVNKAAEKVAEVDRKYQHPTHGGSRQDSYGEDSYGQDSYGRNPNSPLSPTAAYSTDPIYGGGGAENIGGGGVTGRVGAENIGSGGVTGGALDPTAAYGRDTTSMNSTASIAGPGTGTGTGYAGTRAGGPPTNNNLL